LIAVVAIQRRRAGNASPARTNVPNRAWIQIVTGQGVGGKNAPARHGRITTVVRALVLVLAHLLVANALSLHAGVVGRTLISVPTGIGVVHMGTPQRRIAGIGGAEVSVVAVRLGSPRHAYSVVTAVTHRTKVAVIALAGHRFVQTTGRRDTGVSRADVPVFAGVIDRARETDPAAALVTKGAQVAIIAS